MFCGGYTYCKGDCETCTSDHKGWDFNDLVGANADWNDPIFSVRDGSVVFAGWSSSWGYHTIVQNRSPDPHRTIYAHQDHYAVKSGDSIQAGQVLGYIGKTGAATGYHLHFETQRYVKIGENKYEWQPRNPKFKWIGDNRVTIYSGYMSEGREFYSYNNAKFYEAKQRTGGTTKVGNPTTVLAEQMGDRDPGVGKQPWGYKYTYTGGSYGECAIYYETNGCSGWPTDCGNYNNTKKAWLVRTGFYNKYKLIGQTESCLGFPKGDEYAIPGGARQDFRNGYMTTLNGNINAYCN